MSSIDLARLAERIGEEVAVSDWFRIDQARIDRFADATGDRQWIHVDTARAAAESPHGTAIAHGFLTLSLVSPMLESAFPMEAQQTVVNYGLNRVRFVSPVPSGSRVRGRFSPAGVEPADGWTQVVWRVLVEREGSDKPCAAVEWIVRYHLEDSRTELKS